MLRLISLVSQLYRVFPINNDYVLTRLLYSPNASNPSRLLISIEVRTQEQYDTAVKPYRGRVLTNALLRFSVVDDTPHKQPSQRSSTSMDTSGQMQTPHGLNSTVRLMSGADSDSRPKLPPKPAELFSTPFEYISSLSGRAPGTLSSKAPSIRSVRSTATPMDIDQLPAQQSRSQASECSVNESMASNTSCCTAAEVKDEVKALIKDFEKDVNKTLERGFGVATAPQVSISISHPDKGTEARSKKVDLSSLFADGSFPATGPARRGSVRSGCTRNLSTRSNRRSAAQQSGCLNSLTTSTAAQQTGRPLPQVPEPVVHTNVICDSCNKTVVGVRHKCLDCPGQFCAAHE